jgi:uncharacterized protein YjbI with pentapeptide repeats
MESYLLPSEALTHGIRLTEKAHRPLGLGYQHPDDLLQPQIFRQSVSFKGADICPYVLILDGWDEISLAATEGFTVRLNRLLDRIRTEYLHDPQIPIRVILTGRPSTAVFESTFLLNKTPFLTVRPLRPEQVAVFIARVAGRLESPLVKPSETGWEPFDPARFAPAIATYRQAYDAHEEAGDGKPRGEASAEEKLEVLGLPLLMHLAVRLLSDSRVDMESVIENPTTLLRSLVDLTCSGGAYAPVLEHTAHLAGESLRQLLHWTAAAITVVGSESISFEELRMRVKHAGIKLAERVERDTEYSVLSQLMVSYFFKGGLRELGCEFLHKSFQEYLFAEGVIEILKDFGRKTEESCDQRRPYWRDFRRGDDRFGLLWDLSRWLAPQWLSREIVSHLVQLIQWEVVRGDVPDGTPASVENVVGQPTNPLDLAGWLRVRDALGDLWDWWAEGVHLRPQPQRDDRDNLVVDRALAHELVEWAMPLDLRRDTPLPAPVRMTVIDSHLGDALFRLAACVHYAVAVRQGWLDPEEGSQRQICSDEIWRGVSDTGRGPRQCQSEILRPGGSIRFFSPSGQSPLYFENYTARINGAGWRPSPFPFGCDVRGVDFRSCRFVLPMNAVEDPAHWDYANLESIEARGNRFSQAKLRSIHAPGAVLTLAYLREADLSDAHLVGAHLAGADLVAATLANTDLREAELTQASLASANLRGARLQRAKLRSAVLVSSDLTGADLTEADLSGADLSKANLSGAQCAGVKLDWKAKLTGTINPPQVLLEQNDAAVELPPWAR